MGAEAVDRRPPLGWTQRSLAAVFFRIANTTFGGGDPTMAALERELVERRGWLTRRDFELSYALARVTPGTNMIAFCTGAAWRIGGWLAGVLAMLMVTVPSAILVVLLTEGYNEFHSNARVMAAVNGTLAAAVGLMGAAALTLVSPVLRRGTWVRALVFPVGAAALVLAAGWSPLEAVAAAAAGGFLWPSEPSQ